MSAVRPMPMSALSRSRRKAIPKMTAAAMASIELSLQPVEQVAVFTQSEPELLGVVGSGVLPLVDERLTRVLVSALRASSISASAFSTDSRGSSTNAALMSRHRSSKSMSSTVPGLRDGHALGVAVGEVASCHGAPRRRPPAR